MSPAIRRYLPSAAGASPDNKSVCAATSRGKGSCGNFRRARSTPARAPSASPRASAINASARACVPMRWRAMARRLCSRAGRCQKNCAVKTTNIRPSAATNSAPTAIDRSVATSKPISVTRKRPSNPATSTATALTAANINNVRRNLRMGFYSGSTSGVACAP